MSLVLKPQEVPLDSPESTCMFDPGSAVGVLATAGAIEKFGARVIGDCLRQLQDLARRHSGLDYLQVFEDPPSGGRLWFIEDAPGVVTALLPEEH